MTDEQNTGENIQEAAALAETETSHAPLEQAVEQSHDQSSDQSVPLSALQSERAQRQQLQEELKVIKDHLSLLQNQHYQRPQEQPKDELDSLDESDVLTVGEAKKFLSKMNKQYQMSIEELKMTTKYPDYQEVITKYLPEVLKQNPGLRKTLQETQDYQLAYYLAKNSDHYREQNKKAKKSTDAMRIAENSQKAGTLSSVGSSSPISQARKYKDMSDTEFRALVNRNLGGP